MMNRTYRMTVAAVFAGGVGVGILLGGMRPASAEDAATAPTTQPSEAAPATPPAAYPTIGDLHREIDDLVLRVEEARVIVRAGGPDAGKALMSARMNEGRLQELRRTLVRAELLEIDVLRVAARIPILRTEVERVEGLVDRAVAGSYEASAARLRLREAEFDLRAAELRRDLELLP